MSAEPERPEPSTGDRGVFGNLPSERPGVRSPRREGEKRARQERTGSAKATAAKSSQRSRPAPTTQSGPRSRPTRPSPPPPERTGAAWESEPATSEVPESRRGIEDVAWAGVTVAAEAATLGVRMLSRALEAVRERR
jgi:hypothetical protein